MTDAQDRTRSTRGERGGGPGVPFMNAVWVLVCDASRARLFEAREDDPSWHIVESLSHDESRRKVSEIVSDREGNRSSEGGSAHHDALAPSTSPKETEKDRFARALVDHLDRALRAGRLRRWVLVSPPHFLGVVKDASTPELRKHLMRTVERDLTDVDARDLPERLRDAVRVPLAERAPVREPRRRTR